MFLFIGASVVKHGERKQRWQRRSVTLLNIMEGNRFDILVY